MECMFILRIMLTVSEEWLFAPLVVPELIGRGLHEVLQLFTMVDVVTDKHTVLLQRGAEIAWLTSLLAVCFVLRHLLLRTWGVQTPLLEISGFEWISGSVSVGRWTFLITKMLNKFLNVLIAHRHHKAHWW